MKSYIDPVLVLFLYLVCACQLLKIRSKFVWYLNVKSVAKIKRVK